MVSMHVLARILPSVDAVVPVNAILSRVSDRAKDISADPPRPDTHALGSMPETLTQHSPVASAPGTAQTVQTSAATYSETKQEFGQPKQEPVVVVAAPTTSISSNPASADDGEQTTMSDQKSSKTMRTVAVPSGRISRAVNFAGLGIGLMAGATAESARRAWGGVFGPSKAKQVEQEERKEEHAYEAIIDTTKPAYNAFVTDANAERLAEALCRMRGAALKIGQMLSIQEEGLVPPVITRALERVRQNADVMPLYQLEQVMAEELGSDWRTKFHSFDDEPVAAASIGQVHKCVLHDGRAAAVKVQYPGVADSIESDIDNLMRLIGVANVLPPGLYVEQAVEVAKAELALECDYRHEAKAQTEFRNLINGTPHMNVPEVIHNLSSRRILVTEFVPGRPIDEAHQLSQAQRNHLGTLLLSLTLREIFELRHMQTDPNWSNFLYDPQTKVLNLIDFGASRTFPESFATEYLKMVVACANRDEQGVIDSSVKLGFLTGDESAQMLSSHVAAGFEVGIPFAEVGISTSESPHEVFGGVHDFKMTKGIAKSVSKHGKVMIDERLCPPPEEAYSLHRKLSGTFLACMKLNAHVPCRGLLLDTYQRVVLSEEDGARAAAATA